MFKARNNGGWAEIPEVWYMGAKISAYGAATCKRRSKHGEQSHRIIARLALDVGQSVNLLLPGLSPAVCCCCSESLAVREEDSLDEKAFLKSLVDLDISDALRFFDNPL